MSQQTEGSEAHESDKGGEQLTGAYSVLIRSDPVQIQYMPDEGKVQVRELIRNKFH